MNFNTLLYTFLVKYHHKFSYKSLYIFLIYSAFFSVQLQHSMMVHQTLNNELLLPVH